MKTWDSRLPVAANDQQDPQAPWSFTGLTAPTLLQSNVALCPCSGAGAGAGAGAGCGEKGGKFGVKFPDVGGQLLGAGG